ncbi:disulfide bond formation protein B [Citrobacter portucalensis]|uniref:Disulfide bond formation protein B n=2 Tax=Citrobacter portucalensis TaxID=1639133 RepID=A0AAW5WEY5_9ENTR|nr:disulfide bond formation protein B [Citrobacter portucalensis]
MKFILELVGLWLQYAMGLKLCVVCIYERCALLGGLAIWMYSTVNTHRGTEAQRHTMLMFYLSPFVICGFYVRFPVWLPLVK